MPSPRTDLKGQDAGTEVRPPAQKRKSFSPAEKLRIVREATSTARDPVAVRDHGAHRLRGAQRPRERQ